MKSSIDIKHLSREEKLRVMEAIWEDLSCEEESIESPAWHQDALQETENQLRSRNEKILNWKEAKNELQKRFE